MCTDIGVYSINNRLFIDKPEIFFQSFAFLLSGRATLPVAHTMADDEVYGTGDLFQDPEGFYPEEKPPTFAEHRMLSGKVVRVRLVGSHPLYVRTVPPSASSIGWRMLTGALK